VRRAGLAALIVCVVMAAPAAALPPQGVYEECPPSHEGCLGRLDQIARGGFKLVLNYTQWEGDARAQLRYARRAHRLGLQLIWPLNDPVWAGHGSVRSRYPFLRHGCRCASDRGAVRYGLRLARGRRATWGYYVGDQAPASRAAAIHALSRRVHRFDPGRKTLYVALENGVTRGANLRPFREAADYLGADSYPVGLGRPLSDVTAALEAADAIAAESGRKPVAALQAFSWHLYFKGLEPRWPTRRQMRAMRDLALAHNPDVLLWYSYFDVKRADRPGRRWVDLLRAAFG
jgi:hypothetical protein